MPATLLVAESGQSTGWLIAFIILGIRDYGWILGIGCLVTAWFMRRTKHAVVGFIISILFTTGSLLLPASLVLQQVTFATAEKHETPIEVRKAQ